jgi:tetraacyldisaccharide-1-P 4'-kinase
MTAKDAVKCRPFADARFWEVPAVVRLAPDAARHLAEALEKLVEARPITQG